MQKKFIMINEGFSSKNSGVKQENHFVPSDKMVELGSGSKKLI